jgi:hypothetical protein
MEAADEQQPENAGKDRIGVQWTDGGWHHWNTASLATVDYSGDSEAGYTCAKNYESITAYINFGTPVGYC